MILIAACLIMAGFVNAQSLYDPTQLQEIRIYFPFSDWDARLDSLKKSNPDGRLIASYALLNGQRFDSIGIRYKGNSTYNATRNKNPFNIKLDFVQESQQYEGFSTLKLSNAFMDPSFLREALGYQICRQYLPASRANFMKVYVNDIYIGLYTNVENVSNDFLSRNFYSSDNAFFQCDRTDIQQTLPSSCTGNPGSALKYTSADSACYYNSYEKESDQGWAALLNLMKVLNQNPTAVDQVLDVDRALWMLALNNIFVNLDSYSGSGHNYLVYEDDQGRFQTIMWDLNEFYGAFANAGTGGQLSVAQMRTLDPLLHQNNAERPLIRALLSNPSWRKRYLAHVKAIVDDAVTANAWETQGKALQDLIREAVSQDNNKFFSTAAFEQNLTQDFSAGGGPGGGKTYPGLTKFTRERVSFLQSHASLNVVNPVISDIQTRTEGTGTAAQIFLTVRVQNANLAKLFYREQPTDVFREIALFDDGAHLDGAAGDGVYGAQWSRDRSRKIQYYIYAENADIAALSPARAEYEFYEIAAETEAIEKDAILVNELMASNQSFITDESGAYEDWIELYNNTDRAIRMQGLYLSDNPDNKLKWSFPDTSIAARGYLIVWADEDGKDPGLHANFKLSKSGEGAYLYNNDSSLVNGFDFPAQNDDQSYGRCGTGLKNFSDPTFAKANDCGATSVDGVSGSEIILFPNPCRDQFSLRASGAERLAVELFDLSGIRHLSLSWAPSSGEALIVPTGDLHPGIYLIRVIRGDQTHTFRLTKQ